jgi:hypothetical protein
LKEHIAVHGEKSDFLGHLNEKIKGCGVSFYIWTKKGTQGELDWSSLNPMALSCRPSGFYGPYTMDRNNYIEIHPTQAQVAKYSYHHPSKYLNQNDLKLACKPFFQGKHFDLDILMGGDMNILQLVLGLGGSLCNYSCPWCRVSNIKFLNSLSHIRRRR